MSIYKKGKGFPYSIPSIGCVDCKSSTRAVGCHYFPPGLRLSPVAEHYRPLAGTKLYCLVTEANRCEQLAQGCYAALPRVGFEPSTYWSQVQHYTRCAPALPRSQCGFELWWLTSYRLSSYVKYHIKNYSLQKLHQAFSNLHYIRDAHWVESNTASEA